MEEVRLTCLERWGEQMTVVSWAGAERRASCAECLFPPSSSSCSLSGREYFVESQLAALVGEGEHALLPGGLARQALGREAAGQRVADELVRRGVLPRDDGCVMLVRAEPAVDCIDRAVGQRDEKRRALQEAPVRRAGE